jgi:hypothetical protein
MDCTTSERKGGGFSNWKVIVAIITYASRNSSTNHIKAPSSITDLALLWVRLAAICGQQPEAGNPKSDFTLSIFFVAPTDKC